MGTMSRMRWLSILLAGLAVSCGSDTTRGDGAAATPAPGPGLALRLVDLDGNDFGAVDAGGADPFTALFFVRTDCPISNQYAPEIRRICADHGEDGVRCFLVYIDPSVTPDQVRAHKEEFAHTLPAILDSEHRWVERAGATVTPEVAVFDATGAIPYRGRIDNLYETLGRPRRRVTEPDLRNALDDLVGGRPVRTPRTEATGCYIE